MVHFVGAGPGAVDLITVRGLSYLQKADVILYAGSLVNPDLLLEAKEGCEIYDTSRMTLEEVLAVMEEAEQKKFMTVRLHTGDPSLYGAIREQMDALEEKGIAYDLTPGVSAFSGAAASLNLEYTLPGISQTLILTRVEGRTPMPEGESLSSLASHKSSMALFLSSSLLEKVKEELLAGGFDADTPACIVYKATWPEEKVLPCTIENLPEVAKKAGITKTALILVGEALTQSRYERSKLYDPSFSTMYRKGKQ